MYKSSRQKISYNNISYNNINNNNNNNNNNNDDYNNDVIITTLPHIQNPGTFNAWGIFKTFFFLSEFSSQTLTIHRTGGEGRGPCFIPLYHLNPLTNIETFICNFACETTITYFWSERLCLPECYSMRFTTLSN